MEENQENKKVKESEVIHYESQIFNDTSRNLICGFRPAHATHSEQMYSMHFFEQDCSFFPT